MQVPTAGIATALFVAGGYPAAGWASVATCLGTAVWPLGFRRNPGTGLCRPSSEDGAADASYLATLREGVADVLARPALLGAVQAFGLLYGLDAFEEYFPLVARDLQVSTALVPVALLAVPLIGAVGAALGGQANRLGAGALAIVLATGAVLLATASAVPHPAALIGVALYYGLYRAVLVVADARLQERITGPARATVTSVANVVAELPSFAVYAAWAIGGTAAIAVLIALVAACCGAAAPTGRRPTDRLACRTRPDKVPTRAGKGADSRRRSADSRGDYDGRCPPRPSAAGPFHPRWFRWAGDSGDGRAQRQARAWR